MRQNFRGNRFRGNFRGDNRQNSREEYRSERETIGEIEALVMIGLDQGPELVQLGIG